MKKDLNQITQLLDSEFDIDVSMYDESFLEKAIKNRCDLVGLENENEYGEYLLEVRQEANVLHQALKINFSEFFRNPLTFAHLEQWLIPNLIKGSSKMQEIRIWSAGCASGQEPYSIAMLLDHYQTRMAIDFRYRIIATDFSENDLEMARCGIYTEDQVQNVRLSQIREYFTKENGGYHISSKVKENIDFSHYDLLDQSSSFPQESIFGDFDIVLCSNLLFYYRQEFQYRILDKVTHAMANHGYLITGESERASVLNITGLYAPFPPSPIFTRKRFGGAV